VASEPSGTAHFKSIQVNNVSLEIVGFFTYTLLTMSKGDRLAWFCENENWDINAEHTKIDHPQHKKAKREFYKTENGRGMDEKLPVKYIKYVLSDFSISKRCTTDYTKHRLDSSGPTYVQ
jgi:hypothetical protein